jgi:hypothetical protein
VAKQIPDLLDEMPAHGLHAFYHWPFDLGKGPEGRSFGSIPPLLRSSPSVEDDHRKRALFSHLFATPERNKGFFPHFCRLFARARQDFG